MTNTLHRFGKPEELKDDYIVFTLTCPGRNDIGSLEKAREFLKIALKYSPVNFTGESRVQTREAPQSVPVIPQRTKRGHIAGHGNG